MIQDQTFTPDEVELRGKKVLVVGSSIELDDYHFTNNNLDKWDVVIRLNKLYGNLGTRTDIIFTRWISWIKDPYKLRNFFPQSVIENSKSIIIANQNIGISATEVALIKEEAGVEHASIGLVAVGYCLHRGARKISLIGFGDGKRKVYCSNSGYGRGFVDNNTHYDFKKEREFYNNQSIIEIL